MEGKEINLPEYTGDMSRGITGAVFGMTEDGEIYITNSPVHHNVLMGNQRAAAAGHLYSGTIDGRDVIIVYDRSGHYQPTIEHTKQFLTELQRRGLDLKDVYVLLESQSDKGPLPATDVMGM